MTVEDNVVYDNTLSHPKSSNDKFVVYRLFDKVPARLVLYLLSWSGFIVSFIMRNDINLTILAMVKDQKQPERSNITEMHCYSSVDPANNSDYIINYGGTLEWSTDIQYYVLISFYWAYMASQMIGGIVTQRFGTKIVFGYSQFATALCSLSVPWASDIHYGVVIILRVLQGFACGFTWPAMYAIIGHWIPIQERSRFVSSFQGHNIGTGISFGLCGYLIASLGWRSVFYTTGFIGIIWSIIWYFLAFDTPENHPRISIKEKLYIKENTNTTSRKRQKRVPWGSIVRSMAVWSIAVTSFGRVWVHYTFAIYGPLYMKTLLGFSVEKNGLLSGAPFVGSYLSSLLFCYLADKLIVYNLLSLTSIRKMLTCIAQIIPGLLCILIGYLGCNITIILVVWFSATLLLAAAFAGVMSNIVDISPNFAGSVLAFTQTIFLSSTIFSPLVIAYFTKEGHTISAWRSVFNVSGAVVIVTYLVYQKWGTAEIQPWDCAGDLACSNEDKLMLHKQKGEQIDTGTNCNA